MRNAFQIAASFLVQHTGTGAFGLPTTLPNRSDRKLRTTTRATKRSKRQAAPERIWRLCLKWKRASFVTLEKEAKPLVVDDLFGADSPTDRLLLGFATVLERDRKADVVKIAIDDGGLILDISTLRKGKLAGIHVLSTDNHVLCNLAGALEEAYLQKGGKLPPWETMKIEAIKQYRQQTGCGLKEAKDAVEAWENRGTTRGAIFQHWVKYALPGVSGRFSSGSRRDRGGYSRRRR